MSTSIQDVERIRQLEDKVRQLEQKVAALQHIIHSAATNQVRLNGNAPSEELAETVKKLRHDVQGIKMRMGKRE